MASHRAPCKPSQINSTDKKLYLRTAVRNELWKRYRNARAEAHDRKRILPMTDDEVQEPTLAEILKNDLSKFSFYDDLHESDDTLTLFDEILEEFENDIAFQTKHNYFEDIDEMGDPEKVSDEVLCPICQRGDLILEQSHLHCSRMECEMKLNVEQDFNNLKSVRWQLALAHSEHNQTNCGCSPVFCVDENFGIFNLLMIGSGCDFFHIVI